MAILRGRAPMANIAQLFVMEADQEQHTLNEVRGCRSLAPV